jgi:archaellin
MVNRAIVVLAAVAAAVILGAGSLPAEDQTARIAVQN